MAIKVKIKYCKLVKLKPLIRYKGTEMISPTIQKIQFSILRRAINHIPEKKIAVVRVSTTAVDEFQSPNH